MAVYGGGFRPENLILLTVILSNKSTGEEDRKQKKNDYNDSDEKVRDRKPGGNT